MTADELTYLDLVEIGRQIQARQLSSVEVTQAVLDRIARLQPRLKCYATLTPDLALAQARDADSEIARGALRGPLQGVAIAVKDLCHTKGIPTAAGMPIHKEYLPDRDTRLVLAAQRRYAPCGQTLASPTRCRVTARGSLRSTASR